LTGARDGERTLHPALGDTGERTWGEKTAGRTGGLLGGEKGLKPYGRWTGKTDASTREGPLSTEEVSARKEKKPRCLETR